MIQVINGEITKTQLPKVGRLADGRSVSGYDKLPIEILNKEGWLDEEEVIPDYDPATEKLANKSYDIQSDKVVINWEVIPLPVPDPSIDQITLTADLTTVPIGGIATVTAIFSGNAVDSLNCYICVNGQAAEVVYPITDGQVIREFVSSTAGLYKLDFYAGALVQTIFIEVTDNA